MSALFRRNQLATDGGDSLVRCYLLWSMFLPLGARWAVDARVQRTARRRISSVASAALLLQPALLYFVAGIVKDTAPWREGYAVLRALHETESVRPLGIWLSAHQSWCRVLTFGTRAVELVAPVLLFLPLATQRSREIAIGTLLALQVCLAATLHLNFFPLYSSVAWLLFVPSSWWDRASIPQMAEASSLGRVTPARSLMRTLTDCAITAALIFGTATGLTVADQPNVVERAAIALGVAQRWRMYREIGNDYVRIHTEATLANGARVDLRTDPGLGSDAPLGDWARSYRGDLVIEAMRDADPLLLRAFTRFACARWRKNRPSEPELTLLTFTRRVVWQYVPRHVPLVTRSEPCPHP